MAAETKVRRPAAQQSGPFSGIGEMLGEAVSSKKFTAMVGGLGLTWAGLDRFAATHPMLAAVVVVSGATVACSYILGQSLVDAAAQRRPTE